MQPGAVMKRLVLFLDGTWNNERDGDTPTNVSLLKSLVEQANTDDSLPTKPDQRIYYDAGVGTEGPVDRFVGGVLGFGLSKKVRAAYRFLSQFYKPQDEHGDPDEIYIFGFSRGSFTARSLAGFISASGLLRPENCSEEALAFAWSYYRANPKERYPADKVRLTELCFPDVRIHFLGVFDTVGSTGVPLWTAGNWAGSRDRFHDTKLGSAIRTAVQAIALDEHRSPFVPALFAKPDHRNNEHVEQVWFPGVHSDVGGGYAPGDRGRTRLSDISLNWMVTRLQSCTKLRIATPVGDWSDPDDPHDSLGWFVYSRRRPMYRLVDGTPMSPALRRLHSTYKISPPDRSWKESIHRSVFDLIVKTHENDRRLNYLPPQLSAVAAKLQRNIPIICHSGEPMKAPEVADLLSRVDQAIKASVFLSSWRDGATTATPSADDQEEVPVPA